MSVTVRMLARAVESAVFEALRNAAADPAREDHWRRYADRMERKFANEHGRHYSYFIGAAA